MTVRLVLLNDSYTRKRIDPRYEIFPFFFFLFLLAPVLALPWVWKIPYISILIITAGYFINKWLQQPSERENDLIEFTEDSIIIAYSDNEIKVLLSSVTMLEIWSDYYPDYQSGEQRLRHTGHLQIIIKLKDNSIITKQCLIEKRNQYFTLINIIKIWYINKVLIKEFVTANKYMGFLMIKQSHYSYAELQAARKELGIV
jgi:hypothetical protein